MMILKSKALIWLDSASVHFALLVSLAEPVLVPITRCSHVFVS